MFRTDLLSIIRSLNTVFTAIGICHTGYVDCLLARLKMQPIFYVRSERGVDGSKAVLAVSSSMHCDSMYNKNRTCTYIYTYAVRDNMSSKANGHTFYSGANIHFATPHSCLRAHI